MIHYHSLSYQVNLIVNEYFVVVFETEKALCLEVLDLFCLIWCLIVAVIYIGVYIGWWRDLLLLFISDNAQDAGVLLDYAGRYIGWIIAIPLAAAMPFVMDGIMVGATQSRIMRDSMILSTIAYFALFYAFKPIISNNALWLAFSSYMFLRGALQYFMSHRLHKIYEKAR